MFQTEQIIFIIVTIIIDSNFGHRSLFFTLMKTICVILVLLLSMSVANGQTDIGNKTDSLTTKRQKNIKLLKRSILPVSLITIGSIASGKACERNLQSFIRESIGDGFEFHIDDYLQYAPIVEMYIADIAGVKSRNHWFDQTKYLLISNLVSGGITQGLKFLIDKSRPNSGKHSFPSGHTTLAFTNATVLFYEFKDTSPLIAYSGYLFAVTTGVFRILNNKHWLSDVLAGAGIGIISTELVYHFEPFKKINPFKKSKNITLIPQVGGDRYGLYLVYKF